MTDYTPPPGSIPARVIEHLTANGGTLDKLQIVTLTDCSAANVSHLLGKAVRARFLKRDRATVADGRRYVWMLGDRTPGGASSGTTTNAASDEPPLQIVTYDDGDVCVAGYAEAETGGAIFTRAQLQYLVARLTRPHVVLPDSIPQHSGV